MSTDIIERREEGAICHLTVDWLIGGEHTLARNDQTNKKHLSVLGQDGSTNVVVLRGTAGKSFMQATILKKLKQAPGVLSRFIREMMLLMRAQPQIMIAPVDGVATAAGCQRRQTLG